MPKPYLRTTNVSKNTWLLSDTNPTQYWTAPQVRTYVAAQRSLFYISASKNHGVERPWSNCIYQINSGEGGCEELHEIGVQTVFGPYGWAEARKFYRGFSMWKNIYANIPWEGTPYEMAEVEAIAYAKLLSSLKDARTQWNAAVALGESRETARMIINTANKLFRGFVAFKKGDVRGAYRAMSGRRKPPIIHDYLYRGLRTRAHDKNNWKKDITSNWMEFSFGWKPLLGDIDSAARYLAEKHVGKTLRVFPVSRAHKLVVVSKTSAQHPWPHSQKFSEDYLKEMKLRLTYELEPDWLRKPSTVDELGFTDPASVIWELMPLSCFVDYIVNVGQILESLSEFNKWTVRRGLKSWKFTRTKVQTMSTASGLAHYPNPTGYNAVYASTHGSFSWRVYPKQVGLQRECGRAVLTALPPAVPLRIKPDNPFDFKNGQWANMISLAYLTFTGVKPTGRT